MVGAGMMGTAFTVPFADAGHTVRLVGTHLDKAIIEALERTAVHPGLGVSLPPNVQPLPDTALGDALADAEVIGVGVSSAGVPWAGAVLAEHLRREVPIVIITKGLALHDGELRILPDLLQACLSSELRRTVCPAAVAGPCIAGELARRVPTTVVLTGRDVGVLDRLAASLTTPYYHLFPSSDVIGVETCAALKNAYAMGVSLAAGIHERHGGVAGSVALHNLESAIFAQSIFEMQVVVGALGGDPATAAGLAGVGDLDVTCNGGRTGRFGRLLGTGIGATRARAAMPGVTLECLEILGVLRSALPTLERSGRLVSADLPLLRHLAAVALDDEPVEVPISAFFGRRRSQLQRASPP